MEDGPSPALRISQLDAAELDSEVVNLTKAQVTQLFKYHQSGFLAKYDPEIQAAIRLVLWKFALYDTNSTVGQKILGIHYAQTKASVVNNSKIGLAITGREKILYALLMIICPWLRERLSTLLQYLKLSHLQTKVEWWLNQAETVFKVASMVNLLVFLKKGIYLTVVERFLGVSSQYPQRQGLRQVGFEFMTRELLWHGFSEFLFFLLPLINFQRIKNTLSRWVRGQSLTGQGHLKDRVRADLMSCAVCEEWPVLPREIGCKHVFCYFCISANLRADPNFCCPQCGHPVVSNANVQQVKTHINPAQSSNMTSS